MGGSRAGLAEGERTEPGWSGGGGSFWACGGLGLGPPPGPNRCGELSLRPSPRRFFSALPVGPLNSRGLDLAVAPQAASSADSGQLGSGPRVMGSEPREPGRPGRAGGGARLGAGRGGAGGAGLLGCFLSGDQRLATLALLPSWDPRALKFFTLF